MSKKLLLSLASVGVLSAVTFVTFQGNNGGLRSSVVRPAVEIPAYSCAYYVPSIEAYYDLAGNSFSSQDESGNYSAVYDVTETTITTNQHGITALCTPEEIAKYGSIGEDGLFVAYGTTGSGDSDGDTTSSGSNGEGNGSDGTSIKQPSKLETLLTAWNDAKMTLANLETELKTLTDSKKTLTDRKAVLEKKTGTESIAVITARLAAIEKELTAQLTALFKNTKLKSAEEYESAKVQALADFDAIAKEMIPFQNQLTTLTNIELKKFTTDLAVLKADLAALTKIKPQTTQTKADIVSKNKEITAKSLEITNKNKEITAKKAEIAKIQTRKTAAATKYNTLKGYETKYIHPFRTKTSALNKEKEELTPKLARLTAELADIKTKLGDRLPALPELIKKQRILMVEAELAYMTYVQTLPSTVVTGGGTVQGCDTTTGVGCEEPTDKKIECEKEGTMIWRDEQCQPIVTHEDQEACQEPGDNPEDIASDYTCCVGYYEDKDELAQKTVSNYVQTLSGCNKTVLLSTANRGDMGVLRASCSARTTSMHVYVNAHSCSAFSYRPAQEAIAMLSNFKFVRVLSYLDNGCETYNEKSTQSAKEIRNYLVTNNRVATVTLKGNQLTSILYAQKNNKLIDFETIAGFGIFYHYVIGTVRPYECVSGTKLYYPDVVGGYSEGADICPVQGTECIYPENIGSKVAKCMTGEDMVKVRCNNGEEYKPMNAAELGGKFYKGEWEKVGFLGRIFY